MENSRQNPDYLLKAIEKDEKTKNRGKLKIFFGYAAGVGKTYAMLEAARSAKKSGIDVVLGYIEPHNRPQTAALMKGLESIPKLEVDYNGIKLNEFDLDKALSRKPSLILVDELAHTNTKFSRHAKRYQDIEELLTNGIDVYTTVNVQHIESLNDTIASITKVSVKERIPDFVFDDADQVELVDIEPSELLERMDGGKIYQKNQAERAKDNFFTVENLTALREIALRRQADRVNIISERNRVQKQGEYHTDEHILVCLSSSPSNAKIIRTASRMARAFRASFTALYVEKPSMTVLEEDDKKRLRDNMRLAKQLGANVETTQGEDIAYQIAEFARLSGVSKIVIGSSAAKRKNIFSKMTLTERLISLAPSIDIHVIPDSPISSYRSPLNNHASNLSIPIRDIVKGIIVLLLATIIGFVFNNLGFTEANIISVYIFAVLLISTITTNRFCGVIYSIVGVLVFNFFFTTPRYTFHFNDTNYWITFSIMFMVSLLSGSLAIRLKENATQSALSAYRTNILFETNQLLQTKNSEAQVMTATCEQLVKLLNRSIVMYLVTGSELGEPTVFRADDMQEDLVNVNEKAVATWVFKNNKRAGFSTDTLASAKCMYLAIRVNKEVYAVVGIEMDGIALDSFEDSVLLSILGECALSFEGIKNSREKEEAAILAKNEQFKANLLRSISHDLRTPLTSISGNADNLLSNYDSIDDQEKKKALNDIYEDSIWLINLVENLLSVTRIDGGQVKLNQSVELVDDVIREAISHVKSRGRNINYNADDDIILVKIDTKLIVQVIINILDNAVKYTPEGSLIEISTKKMDKMVQVMISDNGPGIADSQKEKVFDAFYTGNNKVVDSRRSLGLGLSLCKSIITVHGGTIAVSDNKPKGACFTFTLPLGEVQIDE